MHAPFQIILEPPVLDGRLRPLLSHFVSDMFTSDLTHPATMPRIANAPRVCSKIDNSLLLLSISPCRPERSI
ncbi:hypothetical protein [Devosia sp.]|uniref:hypothetical protein n=1 Tax=Devosia sp. TaxID=1871048 RepID=UPI0032656CA2